MMTDGIWNSTATSPWGDEADRTLPDGKKYTQQRPFFDATTNTLADLAFYYWATDARPTLGNNVKPVINAPNTSDPTAQYWDPRNDPATWQHLVTFTIGLGLSTSLNANGLPWAGDTYTGPGYQALATGAIVWPPATSGSGNNVYDLWHAAINSRGQFFSADSPDALLNAFNKIINLIGNATSTASMPAVKSAKDDTQVYRAEFTSADWSGDLIKSSSNASGGWSAKAKLDAKSPGERKIMMYDAQDTTHLKAFSWDNLTAAQQAQLSRNPDGNGIADSKGAARVTYLRGDHAGEGTAVGNFRKRDTVLGDIVSSSPLVVGPPVYWGSFADSIEGTGSDYNAFKTANSGRTTMVYVGANDGMLHGFNANTGEENFAYIPSAVIENLYLLTGQSYTGSAHRYFVDGTPVSADVYFDGNWHTVLIGTLGGGGRSLFALDVTDPNNIKLLWEKSFDVNDSNLADLGYSFSKPYIARLYSGQWAVITGNGYSGTSSGNAALMLFDVKTGNVLKKLSVTGNPGQPNGLSSPVVSDYNNDGVAEYAYAGDLQGNLWRFDLIPNSIRNSAAADPFKRSGANGITDNASYVNEFQVAYGGKPLFTAKDSRASALSASQPITAPPSLVRHPTGLGYLVLFGTGKYFEVGDAMGDASRAMSLYGIWDRKTKAQSTDAPASPLTRSDLVTQAFVPNGASTPDKRTLSRNPMVWYQPTATGRADSDVNAWGWVLDLVVGTTYTGELSVHPLKVRGSTLLVDSLIPTNDPCKGGANKWPMGIDVYSGGATLYSVFDINGDGVVDSSDLVNGQVISGYQSGGGGTGGTTTKDGYLFSSDGGPPMRYSSGPNFNGRQSWRSIPEEAQ